MTHFEQCVAAIRPRLLGFIRSRGVAAEVTEDVVQETLIEAWSHLDRLYSFEVFESWLFGICRNVCARWLRACARQVQLSGDLEALMNIDQFPAEDNSSFDPLEELGHQDLQVLLARALSHLPGEQRHLIEICYLAETPRREVAQRLGITLHVLESRLYRARRQLQQVLSGELSTDSQEFGLWSGIELHTGWRESREWCIDCGQHHLQGIFEIMPDGRIDFRMRCPTCGPCFDTKGSISFRSAHSLRPARKHVLSTFSDFIRNYRAGMGICSNCGKAVHACLMTLEAYCEQFSVPFVFPAIFAENLYLVVYCEICLRPSMVNACVHTYTDPAIQQFLQQHRRTVAEPQRFTYYSGAPAIQQRFTSSSENHHISAFVQRDTLQLLAVVGQ